MHEPTPIKKRPGPHSRTFNRGTLLWILAAIIAGAFLIGGPLGSFFVDWFWYQSIGKENVFSTQLTAQLVLFFAAGIAFLIVFLLNIFLAIRLAGRRDVVARLLGWTEKGNKDNWLKLLAIGAGLFLALLVGSVVSGSWDDILRGMHSTPFGTTDPVFGQDISFFVFTLPVYQIVHGLFMTTMFLSILGSLAIYTVKLILPQLTPQQNGSPEQSMQFKLKLDVGVSVKAHLFTLAALLVLGFAVQGWLGLYDIVYSPHGIFAGANYTDIHARLPFQWASIAAAVLFAILLLVNIRRNDYKLAMAGFVVWIGVGIIGTVYAGAIQQLVVQPSELDKERPYIESNIQFTNQAYALDRITEADYPAEEAVTAEQVQANPGTIKNIRLLDPQPLLDTFNQIQSIRSYYDFVDVDVDRYMIDGEYRQVMLSARELSPERLPSQAQTWVNRQLQFTHGYGVAMSPVNDVTAEGLPQLFMQDVPPVGKLPLTRPEIYYGESTNGYVIVKTTTPEFDYPKGNDNVYIQYAGNSGVNVGSFLRRLLFAWQFGEGNILLSNSITPDSKILYNRNIVERAQKIAPFLTYDNDPYVVIADQRIYWILDGYTHTDRYPYSQPTNKGIHTNYIRNSVKVVMDAYDGSIRFFQMESADPLINTYARVYPGLFLPFDQMPKELVSHLRYPEDLFNIQADLYRTYHMKDPRVFYNREDLWSIPNRMHTDKPTQMEPYYVIMRLAGEQKEEFALILPYTPPNKSNMITWLAARCDGDNYGKLVAYKYPKEKLIYGPQQIDARIDQDPTISSQLTLWGQKGSTIIRGDQIVIPIGQSNLYVEPIYLQSEQTKLPEMKRVVLATGNKVVMEPTVSMALNSLFGVPTAPTPPAQPENTPAVDQSKQQLSDTAKALLDRYNKLQEDMSAIGKDMTDLLNKIESAQ